MKCVKYDFMRESDDNPYCLMVETYPLGCSHKHLMSRVNKSLENFEKAIISVMQAALSMHRQGFVHNDIR